MNAHAKPEDPGDGAERMEAAMAKLAFLTMLLSDHYEVCPACMLAATKEWVEENYGHVPGGVEKKQ